MCPLPLPTRQLTATCKAGPVSLTVVTVTAVGVAGTGLATTGSFTLPGAVDVPADGVGLAAATGVSSPAGEGSASATTVAGRAELGAAWGVGPGVGLGFTLGQMPSVTPTMRASTVSATFAARESGTE
ncbi:hypothetical protein Rhe02_90870 [Rhizocola hellebori]|uniref:Uncharacterized protein n=1 Tax=Rhizocola hellebori TaxID=1392758 RepID=A0A8J3VLN5_9ACTN|nr:hypothetical protein Rhe02_90870 [Rhizocola hellebori]